MGHTALLSVSEDLHQVVVSATQQDGHLLPGGHSGGEGQEDNPAAQPHPLTVNTSDVEREILCQDCFIVLFPLILPTLIVPSYHQHDDTTQQGEG